MTLYTAKMKPRDSNEVIAQALASDHECKEAVMQGRYKNNPEFVFRVKPIIKGKATNVYVIKIEDSLKVDGVARAYEK